MAQTGKGREKAVMKSTTSSSGRRAARSSATWATSGSIQAGALGVNPFCASRRYRPCTSGSLSSRVGMYGTPCARIATTSSATSAGGGSLRATAFE